MLRTLLAIGLALTALWVGLMTLILLRRPRGGRLVESVRILPDMVRLLRRLMAAPDTPRTVRIRVVLLLAYLAMPFDLVPDFLPVVGLADDVVLATMVVRSVIKRVGVASVEHHWTGTPDGLATLMALLRLPTDQQS